MYVITVRKKKAVITCGVEHSANADDLCEVLLLSVMKYEVVYKYLECNWSARSRD
jgi:hypothetical protein